MTESAYELLGIRKDFPRELARRADEVVDPELDVRLAGSLRALGEIDERLSGASQGGTGSETAGDGGAESPEMKYAAELKFSPRRRRRLARQAD